MNSLQEMLTRIDTPRLKAALDPRFDAALREFGTPACTPQTFRKVVEQFYAFFRERGLAVPGVGSGTELLLQVYRVKHQNAPLQDDDAYLALARTQGTNGNLADVLSSMCDAMKQHMYHCYIEGSLTVLDWDEKVKLVRELFATCPVPPGTDTSRPEMYANNYKALILQVVAQAHP
jgi:hypothetical protein